MSQSLTATTSPFGYDTPNDETTITTGDDVQTILDALTDADCRTILEALNEDAGYLTASELSERCDVPLSTTYRKIEKLTDAGMLDEKLRIRRSGKHTSEYGHRVDDVQISVEADSGIELLLSHPTA
ncbi:helix-turn-helix domain-containing protein [Natronosalvus caseinilyticus]|uniref:helix-turn-helix domain-containing protein n=1 Tax=Natronosalvus caseinilyticus TaxID=2953747 RepID=UPI0028AB2C00|nr:helix-turn-helix domain-containing protein [Natronosalvus caseinilyticus]